MIGDGSTEQESFALEVIYNYGIHDYERGNDLRYIAIAACSYHGPQDSIEITEDGRAFIKSPDNIYIHLVNEEISLDGYSVALPLAGAIKYISIHVTNLEISLQFYQKVLGANLLARHGRSAVFSFVKDENVEKDVLVELVELESEGVDHQKINRADLHGRFAIETEDGAPLYIAQKVKDQSTKRVERAGVETGGLGRVLHGPIKLKPHNEEVVIVQDPDGHEYCFVDARGFKKCTDVGYMLRGSQVDWQYRKKIIDGARARAEEIISFRFPVLQLSLAEMIPELELYDSKKMYFIEFYSPWCSKCIHLKSFMEDFANIMYQTIPGLLDVVVMDGAMANADLATMLKLGETVISPEVSQNMKLMLDWTKSNGFPSLFYIHKGFTLSHEDNRVVDAYEGVLDEENILDWVRSKLEASTLVHRDQLLEIGNAVNKLTRLEEKIKFENALSSLSDDDDDDDGGGGSGDCGNCTL